MKRNEDWPMYLLLALMIIGYIITGTGDYQDALAQQHYQERLQKAK